MYLFLLRSPPKILHSISFILSTSNQSAPTFQLLSAGEQSLFRADPSQASCPHHRPSAPPSPHACPTSSVQRVKLGALLTSISFGGNVFLSVTSPKRKTCHFCLLSFPYSPKPNQSQTYYEILSSQHASSYFHHYRRPGLLQRHPDWSLSPGSASFNSILCLP